jgi:hypothetical protein
MTFRPHVHRALVVATIAMAGIRQPQFRRQHRDRLRFSRVHAAELIEHAPLFVAVWTVRA